MGYREEGDKVMLTMTKEDYQQLLFLLGYGSATRRSWRTGPLMEDLAFLNRLNEGNSRWTPYTLKPAQKEKQ